MSKVSAAIQAFTLGLILFGISFTVWYIWEEHKNPPLEPVGVSLPQGAAVFETSLQSRISASDTSLTLVANSVRGGSTLSGYQCFTIDEGRTDMEYVCGTVSGTSVTGLERGIDPLTASTTNSSLKFAHRVGANVKITDFPLIQRLRHQASGVDTYENLLSYATTSTLCSAGSSNYTICDKAYVDSTANAGASDANDTTKGIIETALGSEASAGTSLGGTGARLVLGANLGTSTCQVLTNSVLVSSSTTGKLGGNCIDTGYSYNWTKLHLFGSASSTSFSSLNGVFVGRTATTSIQGSTTGTSTFQGFLAVAGTNSTSTFSGNISAVNIGMTGSCFGCPMSYTGSSTAFSIATDMTFTGSIPAAANFGLVSVEVTGTDTTRGNAVIARYGQVTSYIAKDGSNYYNFTWSGSDLIDETDGSANDTVSGTVFWYR